jgi:hypothetical protein
MAWQHGAAARRLDGGAHGPGIFQRDLMAMERDRKGERF